MSDSKLRYTQKLIGKRVCIIEKSTHVFGLVDSVKDWETVVVDVQGDGKRVVSIHDIREV